MKTKIINKDFESPSIKYPWMGVTKENTIVLFTQEEIGVIVYSEKIEDIGFNSGFWDMKDFTEFKGILQLSN